MHLRTPVARLAIFCLSVFSAASTYSQQAGHLTFYVAPTGKSGNPGTLEQPFLRPEEARDAINKVTGPVNATVYIRGGYYTFSKSFVVTPTSTDTTRHITFSNYHNEKVVFTGGSKLDNSKFTLLSDPNILNRLPAAARGKVYQFNLKEAHITDYGKRRPHNYKIGRLAPLELFYGEIPLTLARYPNEGYLPIGKVIDAGSVPRNNDPVTRGAKFVVNDSRIRNWKTADSAWIGGFFSYGYSDDYLKVDTFDVAAQTIRTKMPALYSVFGSDDASTGPLKNAQKMRGFYVYNLLEELDKPGEWYLDESSGVLYMWPPDGSIATADIEVSMLEDPIVVLSNTSNVSITGISFEGGRGMGLLLEATTNTVISHCAFDGLGTVAISTGNQLNDRRIQYFQGGQNKPAGPPYNTNLLVKSCTICNTGAGGILLDGGDRKTLTPANNVVDNCDIYNYSRINLTFSPAVSLNGVGNKVIHCDIHDAPDEAIVFYGNDHVMSFNHIYHVLYYMTDAGAVGTGRDPGSTGNVINNNFFDNISNSVDASTCAVYLDDGSSGMEVDGNLFYKAGTPGTYNMGAVHINGGGNNYFRNNYFVDCHQAFSNSQWNDKNWKDFISDPKKRFNADINFRSEAYAKKYPDLIKLTDSTNIAPRQNFIINTLAYNVPVFSSGTSLVNKNAVNTTDNPGFEDAGNKKFSLLTVPAALKNAPDWKPVPVSEIGMHK